MLREGQRQQHAASALCCRCGLARQWRSGSTPGPGALKRSRTLGHSMLHAHGPGQELPPAAPAALPRARTAGPQSCLPGAAAAGASCPGSGPSAAPGAGPAPAQRAQHEPMLCLPSAAPQTAVHCWEQPLPLTPESRSSSSGCWQARRWQDDGTAEHVTRSTHAKSPWPGAVSA